MRPLADRFWEKVIKTEGCWDWGAHRTALGYGRFNRGKVVVLAHRMSWELHNGPIPKGMHVLHHCDRPQCVNPAHLWLGTHAENMADMVKKNRVSRVPRVCGVKNNMAKLNWEKVTAIRWRRACAREPYAELAREYGVDQSLIGQIVNFKIWRGDYSHD
jgi:HNH endonuclease